MMEIEWSNLKAYQLRDLVKRDATVIIPVGSTEQHGPHLPVQVDSLIVQEVACRSAKIIVKQHPAVVTPTVWTGLAEHHMAFGGTFTLDFSTFHSLLRCICRSVLEHGFRRVLLLNGHGGNITALNIVVGELSRELGPGIATATYWMISQAQSDYEKILEKQTTVCHACEAETSMVLHLKPELVDTKAMASVNGADVGIAKQPGIYEWHSFADFSDSGVIGMPAAASAEKGDQLLNAAARALAAEIGSGAIWQQVDAA